MNNVINIKSTQRALFTPLRTNYHVKNTAVKKPAVPTPRSVFQPEGDRAHTRFAGTQQFFLSSCFNQFRYVHKFWAAILPSLTLDQVLSAQKYFIRFTSK
jgi:hypothetical protein